MSEKITDIQVALDDEDSFDLHADIVQEALEFYKSFLEQDYRQSIAYRNGYEEGYVAGARNEKDLVSIPKVKERIDLWFPYEGVDDAGLKEFIANVQYSWWHKGGKDKHGHLLIFLRDDKKTLAAIRCNSHKAYSKLLEILRTDMEQI